MSDQFVYFIQADEGGPIKIGFTSDKPEKRLAQLQTGNASALKLLGAIEGNTARERQFHTELSEWRLQGEWFEPHATVLATIQKALSIAGDEDHQNCDGHRCSFCGICQHGTLVLIAGPDDIYICGQCVAISANVLADHLNKTAERLFCEPLPAMVLGG